MLSCVMLMLHLPCLVFLQLSQSLRPRSCSLARWPSSTRPSLESASILCHLKPWRPILRWGEREDRRKKGSGEEELFGHYIIIVCTVALVILCVVCCVLGVWIKILPTLFCTGRREHLCVGLEAVCPACEL